MNLQPELPDGNTEYKLHIIELDNDKLNNRMTQMRYRIDEGRGEAFYYIGVMDNGEIVGLSRERLDESRKNLIQIAEKLFCVVQVVFEKQLDSGLHYGHYLVRENDGDYIEVKIGVVGNVDAGKSTTISLLSKGITDDGRGKARMSIFNHKHEIDTGRTSSIGHEIVGFDVNGKIVNWNKREKSLNWQNIVNNSVKIISFFDMAGHEKYLKTTIYGLTAMYPDYCLVLVGANMGVSQMTKEHISLCLSLKIPFIIVITKIDIAPPNILQENIQQIKTICKSGARKIPYMIRNYDDVLNVIKNIKNDNIVPILQVSNVSREGYGVFENFLNLLPVRTDFSKYTSLPTKMIIDKTYNVIGHGLIVCGILKEGVLKVGDTLHIGPSALGEYKQIKVKSIHINFKDVKIALPGNYLSIAVRGLQRKEVMRGMIALGNKDDTKAIKQFWAVTTILQTHSTTIRVGYEPIVHIENIREAVKILEIHKIRSVSDDKDAILRTGDRAHVLLEFISKPKFIEKNQRLIFREGKVKAVGKILIDKPEI